MKSILASVRPASSYWRDVAWLASGTTLAQAINLIGMPLLTRLYEPAAFGILSVFTQAVAAVTVLTTLRFEYAVPMPRKQRDATAVVMLVIALGVAGGLIWTAVTALAWPLLKPIAPDVPQMTWLLVPATAATTAIVLSLQHDLQREGRYRLISSAEIVTKLSYVVIAALAALMLPHDVGLSLAMALAILARGAWLMRGSDRLRQLGQAWERRRTWRRIANRCFHQHAPLSRSMSFSHLLMTGTGLAPTLYIGHAYGANVLGQWALVAATSYLPSALIGAAIGNVYFQRAAQAHASGETLAPLWRETALRLTVVGLPAFALLALLAPWLYPLVFGARWVQAGEFATIMALSAFLAFVSAPMDRTCLVIGAWRYVPAWHAARLISTLAVIAASHLLAWPAMAFVTALTLQMSAMYAIDFIAERGFALRSRSL